MEKIRLDRALVRAGLAATRSQAENYIKLGKVTLAGKSINKSGTLVNTSELKKLKVNIEEKYVSRAAYKLDSAASKLGIDFTNKVVLDIGSSTGGFTDYALKHGAKRVVAVDIGSDQLHVSLKNNPKIELHEKTDIRQFKLSKDINQILIDVSFISIREILASLTKSISSNVQILAMVKPQFESGDQYKHKGVIKNEKIRRNILKDFEDWVKELYVIHAKSDSQVSGSKGNVERFYLLTLKDI